MNDFNLNPFKSYQHQERLLRRDERQAKAKAQAKHQAWSGAFELLGEFVTLTAMLYFIGVVILALAS